MVFIVYGRLRSILNFWKLYGRQTVGLVFVVLLAAGGFFLFRKGWYDYGVISDGTKAVFTQNVFGEKPVIDAENRRILQGEVVKLTELASARDGNGDDLTDRLIFTDAEGKRLSGYLNTDIPGQYRIRICVQSPFDGQKNEKEVLVLVDGRVSK